MNEKEMLKIVMGLDPENIIMTQHAMLKLHVITVLKRVISFLEKDQYSQIGNMLRYSPGGDDMGQDNHYIDFGYDKTPMDMADVIELLDAKKRRKEEDKKIKEVF